MKKAGEDSSATSQKDSQQKDESAVNPTDETEETKDAGQGKIQSHSSSEVLNSEITENIITGVTLQKIMMVKTRN